MQESDEPLASGLDSSPPDDPRWLEEDSDRVNQWDAEQNANTDRELRSWPDRARLREYFEARYNASKPGGRSQPVRFGDFRFHTARPAGAQHASLFVSDDTGERLLVDPEEIAPGSTLDWFYPSPSGSHVAYCVSQGGDEQSVLRVLDTRDGTDLGILVPHASFSEVAWLPDGTGFWFTAGVASDHVDANKRLFFLKLDERTPGSAEPIDIGDPYAHPQLSADGRWLSVTISWEKPQVAWYRDLKSETGWLPFLSHLEGETYGTYDGDTFYVLTTEGAPNGRVLKIPMEHANDPERWTEAVPEGEAVLRSVLAIRNHLVLMELLHGSSRVRVVSPDSGTDKVFEMPGPGTIHTQTGTSTSPFTVDSNHVHFTFIRFELPPLDLRINLDSLTLEQADGTPVGRGETGSDGPELVVRQDEAPGKDGVSIPYWLVHRKDLDLSKAHPTLIYAYGGWNIAIGPTWMGAGGTGVMPFVESGGVYVSASLRGGPEKGRDWWMAGRREHKQNTFDDLYSVTEHLISQGTADAERVAVRGQSNGGLLTAVAVTQRPELFRAVVSEVPLTDMLRAMDHPYVSSYKVEYGDPAEPEFESILRAYSPVHNVRDNTEYPATLILSAASDLRCQPWNGRKLTHMLQQATGASAPILFRLAEGGHGGSLSVDQWLDRRTDVIGFVMQQLGMRLH